MKKLITAAALGLALVAGSASADKLVLQDEQLDNVNAGFALALGAAGAGAIGQFVSLSASNAQTSAFSIPGVVSQSISQSGSLSFAF